MSENPYRLRQENFAHILWLVLMPAGMHIAATVLMGLEIESSLAMMLLSAAAAGFAGAYVCKRGYPLVAAPFAAAWPVVMAAHWHWHWGLGMASPGASSQQIVRSLGWRDASMTASVGVLMGAAGAAGWGAMRFERWYKKKTGRPLFELDD